MRKIVSLLMAMCLVMSVSALPVQLHQDKKVPAKVSASMSLMKKNIKKATANTMETIALTGMDAIDFAFYESYSEDGLWNYSINCYSKTEEFPYLMLDVYTPVKGQLEGTYKTSAGNVGEYSSVYFTDSTNADFADVDVVVSKSGDNYTITGQATDDLENVYTFSITASVTWSDGDYPGEPMEAQGTKTVTIAKLEIDKDYLSDYGDAYYDFTTADGIVIELDWYTEGSAIPRDGTYRIDTTAEAFYAGYITDYGFAGSFYYDEIGEEVYYLTGGTVKIETQNNATTYTVDAVSAHGTKIQFAYTTPGGVTPTPVDGATIIISEYAAAAFTTKDGVYTISTTKGTQEEAKYNPNQSDLRVYGGGTLTISSTGTMKAIVFTLSAKGKERQATITPSTGSMSYDVAGAGIVTWSGEASSVTFSVGSQATYGSDGASKAGQFDFTAITISADGPIVPPTPITDTEIKGLAYADALYYNEDGEYYWDFDLYKNYNWEDEIYTYPELYLVSADPAKSKTSISGTYLLGYAVYNTSAKDSVETDEYDPVGTVTISHVSGTNYRFQGSFVGTDSKTYTFDATVAVSAYDWDNETDITLSEGGVVPPTPGNAISVTEALEIGNALADGATTNETYTVEGWTIKLYGKFNTQYKSQSWYMSDDKTETYGKFEAFQCYPDKEVALGDYMSVTGQITKYVSSNGIVTIEIKNGQAQHIQATSLDETTTMIKPVKFVNNGQLFIQRGEEIFTITGSRVK